ncbi:hypothetical protein PENTCL1PPCAC_24054 [Pristionchus entomophagus]|uniref:Reverse transcriptase/retrotransposon-derived protein RNase H-like domain-containing protein n=1 Tax=Pristionchus entomophagus TaxID=358040 RepID=A0AAV5U4W8_9BILA|nr:hypothetical protein PENTCL1PPCAC_24054 [Pristionchus entomophagus]
MPLRDWTTNEKGVNAMITDAPGEVLTSFLGIGWKIDPDDLVIKTVTPTGAPLTKRTVLSETMTTYDVMGFIAPALLPARRFLKKIIQTPWDEALTAEEQEEWISVMDELSDREIVIPRLTPVNGAELHVFSDASRAGYGCAVYLRTHTEEGVRTFLLMAKSKNTAGWLLRFVRRAASAAGIQTTSDFLECHDRESTLPILTAVERDRAVRFLVSEANKQFPPHPDVIKNFGLKHDGQAWRACISGATAEETLRAGALPRRRQYWMKEYQKRVVLESNDTLVGLQATIANWRLTPVAELSTCEMKNSAPFKLDAELSMVTVLGNTKIETIAQSIPVIVSNILDLSLSNYQYIFILIVSIAVIVVAVQFRSTHKKKE